MWHINWQRTVRALGTPGSKRKPKIKLVKMGNSKVGVDWSARQCGNGAKMGQQRVAEMGHQRVAGGPERNRDNNNSGGAGGLEGHRQGQVDWTAMRNWDKQQQDAGGPECKTVRNRTTSECRLTGVLQCGTGKTAGFKWAGVHNKGNRVNSVVQLEPECKTSGTGTAAGPRCR